nr:hypothetical protein [uncultured Gordonia sp.]
MERSNSSCFMRTTAAPGGRVGPAATARALGRGSFEVFDDSTSNDLGGLDVLRSGTRIDADFDIGGQSDGRAGGLPGSGVLGWSPHAQDGAGVFDGADDFVGA